MGSEAEREEGKTEKGLVEGALKEMAFKVCGVVITVRGAEYLRREEQDREA